MPERTSFRPGTPCWIDLSTSDPEASRRFYTGLLGWEAQEASEEFGGYFMFLREGKPIAGCMPAMPDQPTDLWSVYLATDDLDRTLTAVTDAGGQVVAPAMPVADLGSMAAVADPTGAVVGLWQPGTFPGVGVDGEPGAPSWYEVLTRDYEGALEFYRTALGWQTHVVSDDTDMRYSVCLDGAEWRAGLMDASGTLPEGVPPHWTVYLGVEDADAALATTTELGGSVVMPATDTPYGRIGTAADATGSTFCVVAANEAMPAR